MKALWVLCACILFLIFSSSSAQDYYDYTDYDQISNETDIEDIRLQGSSNEFSGRVEVLYNGTWGTICDTFWSYSDTIVACRMLGFGQPLCSVRNAIFGAASPGVPVWMDRLQCNGRETALDQCTFSGWGENSCSHRDDAGVICFDENAIEVPTNIELVNSTRTTLLIRFSKIVNIPDDLIATRYRIRYRSDEFSFSRFRFVSVSISNRDTELTYSITGLTRNTEYTVEVRFEGRYRQCFSYLYGNYSAPVTFMTNLTVPSSNIPVRLIPPETGLDFIGRVEVFHNNEWGTICDDRFGIREGNVICGMLNHTRAACTASRARLGRGSGQIWLDDVTCPSAEILDHCSFRPWGQHNCDHGDDVGVMCVPESYPPKIMNLTVTGVGSTSVSLSWEPFDFPSTASLKRYSISFIREGFFYPSRLFISSTTTSYKVERLQFLTPYNFSVRAEVRFSACFFTTLLGELSDTVTATPVESPPDTAPTSFHVTVLNCTSIRPEWELPALSTRNGIIRGFRVYVQPSLGGQEMEFNITGNQTTEVIINDLAPNTRYAVSVLAYTVGDGPRSIHLTVATTPENICHKELINFFGLFGNGLNRGVVSEYQRDIHILCGTSIEGAQLDWYFSNGTKVGSTNRNIREGHFPNGTVSLQIASDRRLSPCDSGVYTCRANLSESNQAQEQTYTLIINSSPQRPSRPTLLKITDTTVTFSWQENECNGGHVVESFSIRYALPTIFFRSYSYIRGIDRDQRSYTITGLTPSTTYEVSMQAVSTDSATSLYSLSNSFTTPTEAPAPPEDVRVVLVTPVILHVTWETLIRSEEVLFYTVYAFPFVTTVSGSPSRSRRQADENSLEILAQNISAPATSGNITVHDQSITYHVQVTATIKKSTGILRETSLSILSRRSTIFVPFPGLPEPENVEVVRTLNSSVTLRWNYPPQPRDEISEFQVFYSGMIDGVSPAKTLVMFTHEGTISTTNTEVTIAPLTPSTSYIFQVSALSPRGKGQDVLIETQTESVESDLERYVYFNLRFGPVLSCVDFRSRDIEMKGELIREQLTDALRRMCNCDISPVNIQNDAFGCGNLDHLITYRGRMLGTSDYSGIGLVELLQSWIETNEAFITIDTFRMQVDATCTARLDTIDSPDCPLGPNPISTPTVNPTTSETDGTEPTVVTLSAVRAGEVGGIIVGALILLVLLVLMVIIVVVVLQRKKVFMKRMAMNESSMVRDDDKRPFADMESTHESSLFEEKMKD